LRAALKGETRKRKNCLFEKIVAIPLMRRGGGVSCGALGYKEAGAFDPKREKKGFRSERKPKRAVRREEKERVTAKERCHRL